MEMPKERNYKKHPSSLKWKKWTCNVLHELMCLPMFALVNRTLTGRSAAPRTARAFETAPGRVQGRRCHRQSQCRRQQMSGMWREGSLDHSFSMFSTDALTKDKWPIAGYSQVHGKTGFCIRKVGSDLLHPSGR